MRRIMLAAVLLALTQAQPAAAHHAGRLWATVNICDTEDSPNSMGVRASMPGNGTSQRMWMRFRASYYDRATETWRAVQGLGSSPWVELGDARYKSRQGGRLFKFDPPLPTESYVVRGLVQYQWRKRGKVVRRERQKTLKGHPTGKHGDPRGYSNGVCEITFP